MAPRPCSPDEGDIPARNPHPHIVEWAVPTGRALSNCQQLSLPRRTSAGASQTTIWATAVGRRLSKRRIKLPSPVVVSSPEFVCMRSHCHHEQH